MFIYEHRPGVNFFLKKFPRRAKTCEAESPHTLLVFEIFFKIFVLGAHTLLLQDTQMLRARWLIEQDHTRATIDSFTGQWLTWQQCQISTSLHSEQCQRQHSESNNTSAHAVASQWGSSEMSYPSVSIASVVCAKHARTRSSDFRKNSLEKHGADDD